MTRVIHSKSLDEFKCKKEQQSHPQAKTNKRKKVLWLGISGPVNFRSSNISLPVYVVTRSPLGFENSHLCRIFLHNIKLPKDWSERKKRLGSRETRWDIKERIQQETNKGPLVPRAQEWSSPHGAKTRLKITDSMLWPWQGVSACHAHSRGRGPGKGRHPTASQGLPA